MESSPLAGGNEGAARLQQWLLDEGLAIQGRLLGLIGTGNPILSTVDRFPLGHQLQNLRPHGKAKK